MGIEVLLVVLGVSVFGGMWLALGLFVGPDILQGKMEETNTAKQKTLVQAPAFYAASMADVPAANEDRTVLFIEHYLRREALKAQCFVDQPSVEVLVEDDYRNANVG